MPMGADINRLLIEFDTIFDTDIGMATIINEEFNNPNVINEKMLNLNQYDYKILLLNRHFENPTRMFLRSEYWSECDSLRDQMRTDPEVYERILKASITTSIYDMINEIGIMGRNAFDVTVLCHTQAEAVYARKILPDFVHYVTTDNWDYADFDVEDFDTIFVKDMKTPKKFNNFKGKNLYVSRYVFNLNKDDFDTPNRELYTEYHLANAIEVYLIDVYGDANKSAREMLEKVAEEDNNKVEE